MKVNFAQSVLALAVAIAVGPAVMALPIVYLGVGIGSLAAFFILRDRLFLVFTVAVLYFTGPDRIPPLVDVGGFAMRVDDVLFVLLLGDSIMRLARAPNARSATSFLVRLMLPVGIFNAYIAMSVLVVARSNPSELGMAAASFLRVLATSCYVIIVFTTLTTRDRLWWFLWFMGLLGGVSVLVASYYFLTSETMTYADRATAFLGVDSLGVVSGLLVVLGFVLLKRQVSRVRGAPYLCIGVGFAGILLCKSIAGTFATIATVALYEIVCMRRDMLGIIRVLIGIAVAASIFLVLFLSLRQPQARALITLQGGGSFVQRLILAEAGLEVFKRNPMWGVGWRMSSLAYILGNTASIMRLRARYGEIADAAFPDAQGRGVTVHNMYVQFLAELGLVGTLLFVCMVVYIGVIMRRVLRDVAYDSDLRSCAEYFVLGLVFLLVWWNSNPLFGGQLESFLAFSFVGAVAAIRNIGRQSSLSGDKLRYG